MSHDSSIRPGGHSPIVPAEASRAQPSECLDVKAGVVGPASLNLPVILPPGITNRGGSLPASSHLIKAPEGTLLTPRTGAFSPIYDEVAPEGIDEGFEAGLSGKGIDPGFEAGISGEDIDPGFEAGLGAKGFPSGLRGMQTLGIMQDAGIPKGGLTMKDLRGNGWSVGDEDSPVKLKPVSIPPGKVITKEEKAKLEAMYPDFNSMPVFAINSRKDGETLGYAIKVPGLRGDNTLTRCYDTDKNYIGFDNDSVGGP